MTKKEVIKFTVIFDDDEVYARSAAEAISNALFNMDGIIEWEFIVSTEDDLDEE